MCTSGYVRITRKSELTIEGPGRGGIVRTAYSLLKHYVFEEPVRSLAVLSFLIYLFTTGRDSFALGLPPPPPMSRVYITFRNFKARLHYWLPMSGLFVRLPCLHVYVLLYSLQRKCLLYDSIILDFLL
jgi:hypothetical protein